MTDRESPVSEEELHAFVDGEVAADRRAAVEQWLARHPEDAARVAAWQAQADAIRAKYASVANEPVPARFDLAKLTRAGRRWSRLAAAAALAALLLGGAAGWYGRGVWDGTGTPRNVLVEAMDAHRLYISEVRHPIEVRANENHLNAWLSRRVGYTLAAPNLEPFELKLLGGRLLPGQQGRAAALYMYESASGERFTVYTAKAAAGTTQMRYRTQDNDGALFWTDRGVGYVVSGSTDRERLTQVARLDYDQTDKNGG